MSLCSQCSLNASLVCGGCETQLYCSSSCAQDDWRSQHYALCEGPIKKKRVRNADEEWQCEGHPEWFFKKDVIGEGGFGKVFVACHKDDCHYVAKLFKEDMEEEGETYEREASIFTRLNEGLDQIAPRMHDHFECPGRGKIIIMDDLDGTIDELLKLPDISYQDTEAYFRYVALLIRRLHSKYGIAHGDVRGANIMYKKVEKALRFYLVDFGLSRVDATKADFQRDVDELEYTMGHYLLEFDIIKILSPIFPEYSL